MLYILNSVCAAGYYQENETLCSACPVDTYKHTVNNSLTCSACSKRGPSTTSDVTAASDINMCGKLHTTVSCCKVKYIFTNCIPQIDPGKVLEYQKFR